MDSINSNNNYFSILPFEILTQIFSQISLRDFIHFECSSSSSRNLCSFYWTQLKRKDHIAYNWFITGSECKFPEGEIHSEATTQPNKRAVTIFTKTKEQFNNYKTPFLQAKAYNPEKWNYVLSHIFERILVNKITLKKNSHLLKMFPFLEVYFKKNKKYRESLDILAENWGGEALLRVACDIGLLPTHVNCILEKALVQTRVTVCATLARIHIKGYYNITLPLAYKAAELKDFRPLETLIYTLNKFEKGSGDLPLLGPTLELTGDILDDPEEKQKYYQRALRDYGNQAPKRLLDKIKALEEIKKENVILNNHLGPNLNFSTPGSLLYAADVKYRCRLWLEASILFDQILVNLGSQIDGLLLSKAAHTKSKLYLWKEANALYDRAIELLKENTTPFMYREAAFVKVELGETQIAQKYLFIAHTHYRQHDYLIESRFVGTGIYRNFDEICRQLDDCADAYTLKLGALFKMNSLNWLEAAQFLERAFALPYFKPDQWLYLNMIVCKIKLCKHEIANTFMEEAHQKFGKLFENAVLSEKRIQCISLWIINRMIQLKYKENPSDKHLKTEGIDALQKNNLLIADVVLNEVVEKDEEVIAFLAKAKFRLHNWLEALSFFTLLKNPTIEDLLEIGCAYNKLGRHQEAYKFFKRAYDKSTDQVLVPKSYQAAFASTLMHLKFNVEAEILYNHILPLYKNTDDKLEFDEVRENAAYVKGELGKWREAKTLLESINNPNPFNTRFFQQLENVRQMVVLMDLIA